MKIYLQTLGLVISFVVISVVFVQLITNIPLSSMVLQISGILIGSLTTIFSHYVIMRSK